MGLPRGCEAGLRDLLIRHGIALDLRDERVQGSELHLSFDGRLTDVQERLEACGGRMELLAGPVGTEFRAVVPGGREQDADDRHRR